MGVPLKDMKSPKGDNLRPGPAFWLVLIVIGGATIWQKASAPPEPVTDVRSSENFSRKGVEHMPVSLTPNGVYETFSKRGI